MAGWIIKVLFEKVSKAAGIDQQSECCQRHCSGQCYARKKAEGLELANTVNAFGMMDHGSAV